MYIVYIISICSPANTLSFGCVLKTKSNGPTRTTNNRSLTNNIPSLRILLLYAYREYDFFVKEKLVRIYVFKIKNYFTHLFQELFTQRYFF